MCGGIFINISKIPKKELQSFFNEKQIKKFEEKQKVASFFWNSKPVLPVKEKGSVKLYQWGNKDEKTNLPKTGWAKQDSIKRGKWNWVNFKEVNLPIDGGFEKGVWFKVNGNIKGIIAKDPNNQEIKRVYMVTTDSDEQYQKETKHSRMPIGKFSNFTKIKRK